MRSTAFGLAQRSNPPAGGAAFGWSRFRETIGPEKFARISTLLRRFEGALYVLTAGAITLLVASRFYASLRLQTLYADQWSHAAPFDALASEGRGPWSAPLDDVFIHFDFARSAARGYPFQWSEGNGYSSGGTSLLYPFTLAVGYWLGFRDLELMEWAAVLAAVSCFAFLLGARRLAKNLPPAASYLLPIWVLAVGTLDWALFSGMEVALFLALWMGAYLCSAEIYEAPPEQPFRELLPSVAWFALAALLVTATRPEGITSVLLLAMAMLARRPFKLERSLAVLAIGLAPAGLVLVAQAIANRVLTGETSAAGALVKLEANHPYLDARQVLDSWFFFVKYQILRVTQYHFGDRAAYGWLVWLLALGALTFKSTRRAAAVLLASALVWILVVAANGQVRWQNERYTMPAVAWLLAAAALGSGALLTRAFELRRKIRGALIAAATLGASGLFFWHQAPRFREQLWFFGRASRNIYDQHVRVGRALRSEVTPTPARVLVGDAGAIPYISDLPALDVIGLGGYHKLPFARATRMHIGAAIELLERMSPEQRPDLLAIYPSWWGDFPLWFASEIGRVPVRGNVICGGASKVIYRPDWTPLATSGVPFSLRPGERMLDEVDPADLVDEREHHYRLVGAPGYVAMKLLRNPNSGRPLWDAARTVPSSASESFELSGLKPGGTLRLVIRAAPSEATRIPAFIDGARVGEFVLENRGGWIEASLEGLHVEKAQVNVRLGPADHEWLDYHVFAVGEP
jgi:hypothetical protein